MTTHTTSSRRIVVAAVAVFVSLITATHVVAQPEWPSARPISWVVPYPPGGSTDILGRNLAQRLTASLGTPVVVDNKAGATGTIGGAFVAKAAPDGHTVLGTSIGPQAIAPHLMAKLSFDPLKDLEPVVLIGTIPHVLVVGVTQPMKSLGDLLKAAKAVPGQVSFASGGNGTILQMQAELLSQRTGVKFLHIPYKGDTPALPTMAEVGQKDFVVEQWQAVYLPARTPTSIIQRLNSDINKALSDPSIVELAEKLGVTLVGGTPKRLADLQQSDSMTWARVIRDGNIKAD